ncbi:hypothetical protein OAM96_05770 [Candidatus Poseidoniaceae archaeon]|nr:hypothetical protein [Candidatus Poseidoniaceae archaeon]|tara:strand:- start:368 stop:913 length:546 start_codon:yes stop_codon:yes gene_type:complete
MSAWKPNPSAPLWDAVVNNETQDQFFADINIQHDRQQGPSCVATTLAMIARTTGAEVTVDEIKEVTNSQSPHTWSNALKPYGMQLAYCNNDLRRIENYIDELVEHDDLFLLSFYSIDPPSDPDESGKLCTAHIVTMHKDTIYDTAKNSGSGGIIAAQDYARLERQTKRIFRVVPLGYPRCV